MDTPAGASAAIVGEAPPRLPTPLDAEEETGTHTDSTSQPSAASQQPAAAAMTSEQSVTASLDAAAPALAPSPSPSPSPAQQPQLATPRTPGSPRSAPHTSRSHPSSARATPTPFVVSAHAPASALRAPPMQAQAAHLCALPPSVSLSASAAEWSATQGATLLNLLAAGGLPAPALPSSSSSVLPFNAAVPAPPRRRSSLPSFLASSDSAWSSAAASSAATAAAAAAAASASSSSLLGALSMTPRCPCGRRLSVGGQLALRLASLHRRGGSSASTQRGGDDGSDGGSAGGGSGGASANGSRAPSIPVSSPSSTLSSLASSPRLHPIAAPAPTRSESSNSSSAPSLPDSLASTPRELGLPSWVQVGVGSLCTQECAQEQKEQPSTLIDPDAAPPMLPSDSPRSSGMLTARTQEKDMEESKSPEQGKDKEQLQQELDIELASLRAQRLAELDAELSARREASLASLESELSTTRGAALDRLESELESLREEGESLVQSRLEELRLAGEESALLAARQLNEVKVARLASLSEQIASEVTELRDRRIKEVEQEVAQLRQAAMHAMPFPSKASAVALARSAATGANGPAATGMLPLSIEHEELDYDEMRRAFLATRDKLAAELALIRDVNMKRLAEDRARERALLSKQIASERAEQLRSLHDELDSTRGSIQAAWVREWGAHIGAWVAGARGRGLGVESLLRELDLYLRNLTAEAERQSLRRAELRANAAAKAHAALPVLPTLASSDNDSDLPATPLPPTLPVDDAGDEEEDELPPEPVSDDSQLSPQASPLPTPRAPTRRPPPPPPQR